MSISVILCFVQAVGALLCYNGTFTYKQFGEDPLQRPSIFSRNDNAFTKLRCSLTTLCGGEKAKALLCYNCSSTHRDKGPCAGDFVTPALYFNNSRYLLNNCTPALSARAMCFVRSWSSRAKHAWIIQRGCYQVANEDSLPQDLSIPTRAMTCKHERLAAAEYKVCLCQADWCNAAPPVVHTSPIQSRMWRWLYVFALATLIKTYI